MEQEIVAYVPEYSGRETGVRRDVYGSTACICTVEVYSSVRAAHHLRGNKPA